MSCRVFAVGSLEWIPQRSQSKWSLAADPWYFCVSPAVGVSVSGQGLLHFRLFRSECHKGLGGSWFTACSLCVTWGLWKGCLVHASGSVALCRNHSRRGRRNHKGL